MGQQKAKKRKIEEKEYNCALCKVTATGDYPWLCHLNGKKHRNTLSELAEEEMNKKVSSDIDNKRTISIGLTAVKMEMDNGGSLDAKPTGEKLQTDQRIVKKMKVTGISTTCKRRKEI
jgi:Zinc-finger of C2H2 type